MAVSCRHTVSGPVMESWLALLRVVIHKVSKWDIPLQ